MGGKKNYDSYNFKKLDFASIHRAVRSLENITHFPESFFLLKQEIMCRSNLGRSHQAPGIHLCPGQPGRRGKVLCGAQKALPSSLSNSQGCTNGVNHPPFSEEFAKQNVALKIPSVVALTSTELRKVEPNDILCVLQRARQELGSGGKR